MFKGFNYVYEVYKERSFSRAASNLYISQPSLSASIKRIEEKIGYPIFDRSTKPLDLTEFGVEYIRTGEQMIALEKEFEAFIDDLGTLKKGRLVLGGSNFFLSLVLPKLVDDFSREYSAVDVSLSEARSSILTENLRDNIIDCMIDNKELDTDIFDRHQLSTEELFLAVPNHFKQNETLKKYQVPLEAIVSGKYVEMDIPAIDLHAFEECPFLILHPENDTGRRAFNICSEQDFKPNIAFELDQQMTAYNIACSGIGITFVGNVLISSAATSSSLTYYRFESEHKLRNIYIYWKKGRYMTKAAQAFIDHVIANFKG